MTDLEKAQEALATAQRAIDAVALAGNHDRKTLGQNNMNGHYVKALQELEMVKQHAKNLIQRAEAQV